MSGRSGRNDRVARSIPAGACLREGGTPSIPIRDSTQPIPTRVCRASSLACRLICLTIRSCWRSTSPAGAGSTRCTRCRHGGRRRAAGSRRPVASVAGRRSGLAAAVMVQRCSRRVPVCRGRRKDGSRPRGRSCQRGQDRDCRERVGRRRRSGVVRRGRRCSRQRAASEDVRQRDRSRQVTRINRCRKATRNTRLIPASRLAPGRRLLRSFLSLRGPRSLGPRNPPVNAANCNAGCAHQPAFFSALDGTAFVRLDGGFGAPLDPARAAKGVHRDQPDSAD